MITKHFFKALFVFTLMIALGLIGVFLVGYLDQKEKASTTEANSVAK